MNKLGEIDEKLDRSIENPRDILQAVARVDEKFAELTNPVAKNHVEVIEKLERMNLICSKNREILCELLERGTG